jgi:hypothetical protein
MKQILYLVTLSLASASILHAIRQLFGYEYSVLFSIIVDAYDDVFYRLLFGKLTAFFDWVAPWTVFHLVIEKIEQTLMLLFIFFVLSPVLAQAWGEVNAQGLDGFRYKVKLLGVRTLFLFAFLIFPCSTLPPNVSIPIIGVLALMFNPLSGPYGPHEFARTHILASVITTLVCLLLDRLLILFGG